MPRKMFPLQPRLPQTIKTDRSVGMPEDTTKLITLKALEDLRDPRVLTLSRAIIRNTAETNRHPIAGRLSEIAVIDQFVQKNIRYTRDPVGIELVHRPSAMLERAQRYGRWAEDCESIAGLVLTLLMSLGHRCRLTIVSFKLPERYTHIFAESHVPRVGWVVIDPTAGSQAKLTELCRKIRFYKHFYPEQVKGEFQKRQQSRR